MYTVLFITVYTVHTVYSTTCILYSVYLGMCYMHFYIDMITHGTSFVEPVGGSCWSQSVTHRLQWNSKHGHGQCWSFSTYSIGPVPLASTGPIIICTPTQHWTSTVFYYRTCFPEKRTSLNFNLCHRWSSTGDTVRHSTSLFVPLLVQCMSHKLWIYLCVTV